MNSFFIGSLNLQDHPIKQSKLKIQIEYYNILSYMVTEAIKNYNTVGVNVTQRSGQMIQTDLLKQYVNERLNLYYANLHSDSIAMKKQLELPKIATWLKKPWRKKYRLLLACDIALILIEKELIYLVVDLLKEHYSNKQIAEIEEVFSALFEGHEVNNKQLYIFPLIRQYRENFYFSHCNERRIIVTANMSAGKSTLINSLVGKSVARTSQEVCTGNICYLYNKAFDDNKVHLATKKITLDASSNELYNYEWTDKICIASYFNKCKEQYERLCIIDTPGVDAALHKEHSEITQDALKNETYDVVLYVVCPTNLGTDAEIRHLKWVHQNVSNEKVVFVLNKLDNYRDSADSIEESIEGLRNDLLQVGFEKPIICPISAYFSYLIKLKLTEQPLSADESDEYEYMAKKFSRPAYDLSSYYDGIEYSSDDSEEIKLSKSSGLYGLEKIIYGGKL